MKQPLARCVCIASVVSACSRAEPPSAVVAAAPSPALEGKPAAKARASAPGGLDARRPLPLLAVMAEHQKQAMRDHLVAVQDVVTALSIADFAGVEAAAARIGYSEQMGQTCGHMGALASGFTEQAIEFHHTADRIGEAARRRDGQLVLKELGATLQTCTSCHAVWKQEVVDESTWHERMASAAAGGRD